MGIFTLIKKKSLQRSYAPDTLSASLMVTFKCDNTRVSDSLIIIEHRIIISLLASCPNLFAHIRMTRQKSSHVSWRWISSFSSHLIFFIRKNKTKTLSTSPILHHGNVLVISEHVKDWGCDGGNRNMMDGCKKASRDTESHL